MKNRHIKILISSIIFCAVAFFLNIPKSQPSFASQKTIKEDLPEDAVKNRLNGLNKNLTIDFRGIDIIEVFKFIAFKGDLNISIDQDVTGKVSLFLKDIKIKHIIKTIVKRNKLAYAIEEDIINIMTEASYEQLYGEKYDDHRETRVMYLKYANPEDVFSMLDKIKSKVGNIVLDKGTKTLVLNDIPTRLNKMENILLKLDRPTITKTFFVKYSDVDLIKTSISAQLTPGFGTIEVDKRSRAMVVNDFPEILKKVEKMVAVFDKRPQQVLIEAKIMKVELNNEFAMGVDWEYFISSVSDLRVKGVFPSGLVSPAQTLSIGKLPEDKMTAAVSFLETVGKTEILSSPHIMVRDSEEAKILVGQVIPVISETTTTSQGIATSTPTVEYLDLGVKLFVRPVIGDDSFISMSIKPEVSSLLGFEESSQGSKFPKRETSEAETTIIIKDGVTLVIGGLIKEDKKESESKFPLLGDIPFLGTLFRKTSESVIKSELVVFVTPHIVAGDRDILDKKLLSRVRKPLLGYAKGNDRKPLFDRLLQN